MIFLRCRFCQEINLTDSGMTVILALTNRERVGHQLRGSRQGLLWAPVPKKYS